MNRPGASERLVWAVRTLAVEPEDRLLEIGCGHGVAVSLVCEKLDGGHITAIDRSAKMIELATKRNAAHVAAGAASLRTAPLHRADLGDERFDKIFAVNVGRFWRRRPVRELELLGNHLAPERRLFLFHEPPPGGSPPPSAGPVPELLEDAGFGVVEILEQALERTHVICVVAEKKVVPR